MISIRAFYLFSFCLLMFSSEGYGQHFVGKTKEWCTQKSSGAQLKPTLVFDNKNECTREIYWGKEMPDCENIVKLLTKDSTYGWIRINENQWVSNFDSQLLIEVHEIEKRCRTQILRTAWTKELYELLLKNE